MSKDKYGFTEDDGLFWSTVDKLAPLFGSLWLLSIFIGIVIALVMLSD